MEGSLLNIEEFDMCYISYFDHKKLYFQPFSFSFILCTIYVALGKIKCSKNAFCLLDLLI